MARAKLSLYALDRPALQAFSAELKQLLLADDRPGLARVLGLAGSLAERIGEGPRAVDWFLRADDDADAAPVFASLRRIAKKRALSLAWTSAEPSLEGRLRQFDVLRDDPELADLCDKLLDPARLPWFLVRPGATGGWLAADKRERLARAMAKVLPALPKELVDFAEALDGIEGDVVAHDAL